MNPRKKIALVAHDNKKQDLLEWARFNIAVNCVAPGGVKTRMTAAIPEYRGIKPAKPPN